MNILFDYQAFEQQNIGGVSRLYSEISSYLRLLGVHTSLGVKESDNVYLKEYEHQLNTIRRNKGDNLAQAKLFC